jgi:hypothetical protein
VVLPVGPHTVALPVAAVRGRYGGAAGSRSPRRRRRARFLTGTLFLTGDVGRRAALNVDSGLAFADVRGSGRRTASLDVSRLAHAPDFCNEKFAIGSVSPR